MLFRVAIWRLPLTKVFPVLYEQLFNKSNVDYIFSQWENCKHTKPYFQIIQSIRGACLKYVIQDSAIKTMCFRFIALRSQFFLIFKIHKWIKSICGSKSGWKKNRNSRNKSGFDWMQVTFCHLSLCFTKNMLPWLVHSEIWRGKTPIPSPSSSTCQLSSHSASTKCDLHT